MLLSPFCIIQIRVFDMLISKYLLYNADDSTIYIQLGDFPFTPRVSNTLQLGLRPRTPPPVETIAPRFPPTPLPP